jgi:poly-gamma-glutamate capsule biosynthesis protein CapA/YwtB (metallophosphatase superfamily)
MMFGDVNLGRAVGQQLLRGNLDYPFERVKDSLSKADVVFANLESQLSDQNGETQDPRYNLIFCGPPSGAQSLKQAHVSVVSTANNHAFDYGVKALRETIQNLQGAGISFAGTSVDSVDDWGPAIVEVGGMRIGFLAYTQFVNLKGAWKGQIALFDSLRARRDLQELRPKVDLVVVSYHGGVEYTDKPTERIRRAFHLLAEWGADVVVGHHPHYVQGIELYEGKLLFYSLGNFVFYQPQREWTQFGLGVELVCVRDGAKVEVESARLLPVHAGLQPSFVLSTEQGRAFYQRLKRLSQAPIYEKNGEWFIQVHQNND